MSPVVTEGRPEDAIRLFTLQDPEGQVDSVVPIRWCISRETAEMIQKEGIEKPQLIIVVEHNGEEMDRYVVPLESHMRFVQFRRPGHNVVRATIMWTTTPVPVKKALESRFDSGHYKISMLEIKQPRSSALEQRYREQQHVIRKHERADDEDGADAARALLDQIQAEWHEAMCNEEPVTSLRERFDDLLRIEGEARLTVRVPEQMFAKKPPRLIEWLGNRYTIWERAPRDQCVLRKRALGLFPYKLRIVPDYLDVYHATIILDYCY